LRQPAAGRSGGAIDRGTRRASAGGARERRASRLLRGLDLPALEPALARVEPLVAQANPIRKVPEDFEHLEVAKIPIPARFPADFP